MCVGLGQELGHEFGVDFDEVYEFGGAFVVCFLDLKMRLMSLEVCDEFGGAFDEFGCGFGAETWRWVCG